MPYSYEREGEPVPYEELQTLEFHRLSTGEVGGSRWGDLCSSDSVVVLGMRSQRARGWFRFWVLFTGIIGLTPVWIAWLLAVRGRVGAFDAPFRDGAFYDIALSARCSYSQERVVRRCWAERASDWQGGARCGFVFLPTATLH